MDHKHIRSLLQDALEAEVPSANIHLWPAVKHQVAGKQPSNNPQGVNPMPTPLVRRGPRVALAALSLLALFALLLATPQGQSFAQQLMRFFSPAAGTSFPVPADQLVTEPAADSPTVAAPSPLLTVAEAEAQVGLDAAELPFVPQGFTYQGARVYGNFINIEYQTPDLGGHLHLTQSRFGYFESEWDRVPAEYVVPVKIGALDGEFVQGRFVVYAGDTTSTWNPAADILRLRWQKDGVFYEITKFGDIAAIEYLDQAGLVALAEALMGQ